MERAEKRNASALHLAFRVLGVLHPCEFRGCRSPAPRGALLALLLAKRFVEAMGSTRAASKNLNDI